MDGHKSGDLRPYVYVTRDYGARWESISSNLPEYGNVNTVRQDPRNRNLLYAGTEFEFFVSLDEGGSWHRFEVIGAGCIPVRAPGGGGLEAEPDAFALSDGGQANRVSHDERRNTRRHPDGDDVLAHRDTGVVRDGPGSRRDRRGACGNHPRDSGRGNRGNRRVRACPRYGGSGHGAALLIPHFRSLDELKALQGVARPASGRSGAG